MTKVPEIMKNSKIRKVLEERHLVGSSKASNPSCKIEGGKIILEFPERNVSKVAPPNEPEPNVPKLVQNVPELVKEAEVDVDTLVKMIEGNRIKSNNPNPKKAAKKARQKEKKEMERLKLAEENAREEEVRKAEELRRLEAFKKKENEERQRRELEELERRQEAERKQKEDAKQKIEEEKRELERRQVEEKRLKKTAKKLRREQRKKDLEMIGGNDNPTFDVELDTLNSSAKTDVKNVMKESDPQILLSGNVVPAGKESGRIKEEKEQRKRKAEEAEEFEKLQTHERAPSNKKEKKKKP